MRPAFWDFAFEMNLHMFYLDEKSMDILWIGIQISVLTLHFYLYNFINLGIISMTYEICLIDSSKKCSGT